MKRSIFMVALMAIILTACAPTETGTPRIASLGSHQDTYNRDTRCWRG
ncbi:hypothetical protein [Listeria booriae]|nr:hypothetical protein [Listeria booriae]MBC2036859.1 hypothetical protein [Listeria booriae]